MNKGNKLNGNLKDDLGRIMFENINRHPDKDYDTLKSGKRSHYRQTAFLILAYLRKKNLLKDDSKNY